MISLSASNKTLDRLHALQNRRRLKDVPENSHLQFDMLISYRTLINDMERGGI